eukprot:GHVS01019339.1.p1 GENE.GHVS01019339.1~~GHVS01019339.1.p1  ORF type:complete len:541 (+),score=131.75 GHVS01019339.1:67-1623(+)
MTHRHNNTPPQTTHPYHPSHSPIASHPSSSAPVTSSPLQLNVPPSSGSCLHPLSTPQFYKPTSSSSSLYLSGAPTNDAGVTTTATPHLPHVLRPSSSFCSIPPPTPSFASSRAPASLSFSPLPPSSTNNSAPSSSFPDASAGISRAVGEAFGGELARSVVGGMLGNEVSALAAGMGAVAAGVSSSSLLSSSQVSQLQTWFPQGMDRLRRYFAVSHSYVVRKLFFVSSPLIYLLFSRLSTTKKNRNTDNNNNSATNQSSLNSDTPSFSSSSSSSGGRRCSSLYSTGEDPHHHNRTSSECASGGLEDVCEAELYIPLMGLVSYVLMFGVIAGTTGKFSPEVLGSTATFAISLLAVEVAVAKLGFYLCGGGGVSAMDLVALCGYKFVNVVAIILGCLSLACFAGHDTEGGYEEFWGGGGGKEGGGERRSWKRIWGGGSVGDGNRSGGSSSSGWVFVLYWLLLCYFSCSSVISTLYTLNWYGPGQTETASNWELHLKSSKTLKYLMVAVSFAQLPLCTLLCP